MAQGNSRERHAPSCSFDVPVPPCRYLSMAGDEGASGRRDSPQGAHAFISYVREDSGDVGVLQHMLEAAGVPVWRDTDRLWPGEDWRARIRDAITGDALVFIACFSSRSVARRKSYQNEELSLAIDQLRQRQPDDPWLIPVRFDDCVIPDRDLGAGRTLASLQRADLFGADRDRAAGQLVAAVQRLLRLPDPGPHGPQTSYATAEVTSFTPAGPAGTGGRNRRVRLAGRRRRLVASRRVLLSLAFAVGVPGVIVAVLVLSGAPVPDSPHQGGNPAAAGSSAAAQPAVPGYPERSGY